MSSLSDKKIVCLGSGLGTVTLLRGLKKYVNDITIIATTTDDGGSGGRLRRLFNTLPPGDLVSCIAALCSDENPNISQLLTYRFPGDRYGSDNDLGGQKLGNLMLIAAKEIIGDYDKAVELIQKITRSSGKIYPATNEVVTLSAVTKEGVTVHSEENIDLAKYEGKPTIDRIFITPENPSVSKKALQAISEAEIIIVGPGDLYTTILPVLIVPAIRQALLSSQADKIFNINIANKPQETEGYSVQDFISAVEKHLKGFPFQYVLVNSNTSVPLSSEHEKYTYVVLDDKSKENAKSYQIIEADLINEGYSIYHDADKLASAIAKLYNK